MENKDFDKFIKQGLENNSLTTGFSSDWERMEEMLGMDEVVVGDEAFDQYLKQGLEHPSLAAAFSSDWNGMEKMLDIDEMAVGDEAFDQYLKQGLGNTAAAYSGNWDMMEGMLDKDERERKELVYIKGIEFALVILTIITLFQFYPDANTSTKNPFQSANAATVIQEYNLNATTENHLALNDVVGTEETDIFSKKNKANNSSKNNTAVTSRNNIPTIIDESPIQTMNPSFNDNPTAKYSNYSGIETPSIPTVAINDNSTNIEKATIPTIIDESLIVEENVIKEEKSSTPSSKVEAIKPLDNSELATFEADVTIPITVLKPQFRTSYHVGIDRNHVFTPYNTDSKSSFKQANYGFSTGVKVSLQKGKWEFETGLSYIRKAYRPQPVFEITGSSLEGYEAETLKKLTFNTIAVPLDIRFYTLDKSNKWNLYILTGANFNMVAWSNYGRYTYDISNGGNSQGITSGRPLKSINNQKSGVFFGESLKDNFYMTATLGVGMEVNLNERASFFTQPKFTYYLLPGNVGLGPNNDQFNTISVDLGFRFKM